ncbi:MAG TPA: hypothetical protein PLA50_13260 [Bacteroidia bacterium]|nr:hypothetical protein [Bacteroidia bacterium]
MSLAIGIAAIVFSGLSFLAPFLYGLLFGSTGDWSAIIDFAVAASVVGSASRVYVKLPNSLWIPSMMTFFAASMAGFFHHFRDSGESGPLPFEWLNQYYQFGLPSLILILLSVALARRQQPGRANCPR